MKTKIRPQPVPQTVPELAGLLQIEHDDPVGFAEAKVQAMHAGCDIRRNYHGANHWSFLVVSPVGGVLADYDLRLPYHPAI
jgi:hypothetical protein